MTPPLAVDIDGTLTRPDKSIDPRVFDALRAWAEEAPVVIATGKAFPYPIGLCEFLGIPLRAIAENGGVTYVEEAGEVIYNGDPDAAWAVAEAFDAEGYDLGWGPADMVNRWRETEVAVSLDRPGDLLRELAAREGQEVVDTGYAYHVKTPGVDKGTGLVTAADGLDLDPEAFVAVGDAENDAEVFGVVGESFAVANADEHARGAADHVLDTSFADGFLTVAEAFGIESQ